MSKQVKKIIRKSANKNTPRYAFGVENALSMAGFAAPLAGSNDITNIAGGAIGGATAGMSLGPIGASIGGLVGGVAGIFKSRSQKRAEESRKRMQKEATQRAIDVRAFQHNLGRSEEMAMEFEADNPIVPTFKYGTEGNAQVNNNEVIQYPNGRMKQVQDNSGIVDNVSTVLPNDTSVFSDDIIMKDGKSIAAHAKKYQLIKDKKYASNSKFAQQSKKLNDAHADKNLERLKMHQSSYREANNIPTGGSYQYGTEAPGLGRMASRLKSRDASWRDAGRVNVPIGTDLNQIYKDIFAVPGLNNSSSPKSNILPEVSVTAPRISKKSGPIDLYLPADAPIYNSNIPNAIPNQSIGDIQPLMPTQTTASKKVLSRGGSPKTVAPIQQVAADPNSIAPLRQGVPQMNASAPVSINGIIPQSTSDIPTAGVTKSLKSDGNKEPLNFGSILNAGQSLLTDHLSLAPYRYNKEKGNEVAETVVPEYNRYGSTINKAMRSRRINDTAAMEMNRRQKSIQRSNASKISGSGQGAAYGLAGDVILDRQQQDVLQQNQQVNNAYVGEYANTLMNLGGQMAQANTYAEDANARNRAARDSHRAAAAEGLSGFAQNKMQMLNKSRNNKAKLAALTPLLKEGLSKRDIDELLKYLN